MALKGSLFLVLVILLYSVVQGLDTLPFNRNNFPKGFVFGTASSAYQYEGATGPKYKQDSIWDTFVEDFPDKVHHNTGKIAVDFYHHYKDDVAMMKDIGLDAFRFSIAWSRLFRYDKHGKWELNKDGVEFYQNLTQELIDNGMKPFATLFHWDTPQPLEKHGGFLNSSIVDHFVEFANQCFHLFGDKVKHWTTFNEPHNFCGLGYATGQLAPGRCTNDLKPEYALSFGRYPSSSQYDNCTEGNSGTEPYIVAHNILLAHAKAVQLYNNTYKASQNGSIGITLNVNWVKLYNNTKPSKKAQDRALAFTFGWFMDPLHKGDYPYLMKKYVRGRLPKFTKSESELLKGAYDFLGLNYYTTAYAIDVNCSQGEKSYYTDSCVQLSYKDKNGNPIGPRADVWLYIYPQGISDLMHYTGREYGNIVVYVTENGVDRPNEYKLHDPMRVEYHNNHLSNLSVIAQVGSVTGVDLRGYFIWSFMDNFEWTEGYMVRFGVVYVNYTYLTRTKKNSAYWLSQFLQPNNPPNKPYSI